MYRKYIVGDSVVELNPFPPRGSGGKGLVGSGSILSGLVDKLWTTGKIRFLNRAKTFKFNIFLSLSFSPPSSLSLSPLLLSLPSFSLSLPLLKKFLLITYPIMSLCF